MTAFKITPLQYTMAIRQAVSENKNKNTPVSIRYTMLLFGIYFFQQPLLSGKSGCS